MKEEDNIFLPIGMEGIEVDPQGEILEDILDMDKLDEESKSCAIELCKTIREIYFNDEFMKEHPLLKKRLDHELENFRMLIKYRISDEFAHDSLLKAIAASPNNASLYAQIANIQKTGLAVKKEMDETIKNIDNLLKNQQMVLDFDNPQGNLKLESEEGEDEGHGVNGIHRGSKSFINEVNKEIERKVTN